MEFLLHIIARVFTVLPTVLGYNLLFGKGKVLHFGQEAFSVVAAYCLWIPVARYGFSLPLGMFFGLMAVSALAVFMAWLSFRLEADGYGVLSIALHLMLLAVVLNWQSVTRGALGVTGLPRPALMESLIGFTIVVVLVGSAFLLFMWWIDRGTFGRSLTALAEHPWHAQALGIRRSVIHTAAFLIAGLGAFITNFFSAAYLRILNPDNFHFPALIFVVTIVVAGGPGSVRGATIATFFIVFLREGLRFVALPVGILGPVRLLLYGVILLTAVWWRRKTIFPPQRKV